MFPDKLVAILHSNSATLETQDTVLMIDSWSQEEIQTWDNNTGDVEETQTTIPLSETGALSNSGNSILPTNTELTGEHILDLSENNNHPVSTDQLLWSGNTINNWDNSWDNFDPFAEISDVLDEPSPYQEEIDSINSILESGQTYLELGQKVKDASIIKYANVIVKKATEDLAIIKDWSGVNIEKIDQHIKLFDNYLKKLESLAPDQAE